MKPPATARNFQLNDESLVARFARTPKRSPERGQEVSCPTEGCEERRALSWASQCGSGCPDGELSRYNLRIRRSAVGRLRGPARTQNCLRSTTQVNGWMVPAGVTCSSRSWLISSHLAPTWRASCTGL